MFLFVVLPILTVGAIPWLIGFLVFSMFAGFVLSIVFQLAHTVEQTDFPRQMPAQVKWKMNGPYTN
jgi:linoleoyl-CoA desaturase